MCRMPNKAFVAVAAVMLVASGWVPVNASAAPPNDDIANATPLNFQGAALTVHLVGATTEPSDPGCGAPVYQTVWYRYTSPVDQFIEARVSATTGSTSLRPRLAVWTGAPGALTVVQCNADAHEVEFQASAGSTYYFEVYSPAAKGETTLNLNVNPHAYVNPTSAIPPLNDLFWYAVEIPGLPWTTTADVGAAQGDDAYDPLTFCSTSDGITTCYPFGDTIWYRFTADSAQEVDALFTSVYDGPVVQVMTGDIDTAQFVANSFSGKSKPGATRFTTQPGVTYMIEFASGGAEHLSSLLAQLAVRPAPPPTGGTVSVSPTATLYRRLVVIPDVGYQLQTHVVVTAHVTCQASIPSINVGVTVNQGAHQISGSGSAACFSGAGDVTIDMNYAPNGFHGGASTASATASDYDSNYHEQVGPVAVTLKASVGP
jgi:hypothetical protein